MMYYFLYKMSEPIAHIICKQKFQILPTWRVNSEREDMNKQSICTFHCKYMGYTVKTLNIFHFPFKMCIVVVFVHFTLKLTAILILMKSLQSINEYIGSEHFFGFCV